MGWHLEPTFTDPAALDRFYFEEVDFAMAAPAEVVRLRLHELEAVANERAELALSRVQRSGTPSGRSSLSSSPDASYARTEAMFFSMTLPGPPGGRSRSGHQATYQPFMVVDWSSVPSSSSMTTSAAFTCPISTLPIPATGR